MASLACRARISKRSDTPDAAVGRKAISKAATVESNSARNTSPTFSGLFFICAICCRIAARRYLHGRGLKLLAPPATSADVFGSSLGCAGYSVDGFALQNARKFLSYVRWRRSNGERSTFDGQSRSRSASASPIAAECLNPWPEQGEAKITRSCSGCASITKRARGAFV